MGISALRTSGRLLSPVVAAVLLVGVSLEASATPGSKGTIEFETGKSLTNFFFVYVPVGGTDDPVNKQTFAQLKGCTTELDGDTPSLVESSAFRGTTPGTLGYIPTSIGVFNGPQGTACGRVSEDKGESLVLALAGSLPNDANAFDRLELDLEVKGDVVLRLDVKFDDQVVSRLLPDGRRWRRAGGRCQRLAVPR